MLSAHPARALVSYDDIAAPSTPTHAADASPPPGASGSSGDPPAKKRKRNNAYAHSHGQHSHGQRRAPSHWDDPEAEEARDAPAFGAPAVAIVSQTTTEMTAVVAPGSTVAAYEEEEHEESRNLTQQEMWDDSALIDAWKAAEEEYEALNGPDKAWKKEPVNKSPLWYNRPPAPSSKGKAPEHTNAEAGPSRLPNGAPASGPAARDPQPHDFHTVPSHDPALASARPPPASQSMPGAPFASAPIVSRDEAFQNAMSAMYWSGYWTAAYHYQAQDNANHDEVDAQDAEEEEEAEVEEEVEMNEDELVSTQR